MKRKIVSIPTVIGILILIVGLGVGVFLVQKGQRFFLRASPETTPKQVEITNISDKGFTVSWITDAKIAGFVKYGVSNKIEFVAADDRDQLSGKTDQYITHHVTVKNLEPSTAYSFEIGSSSDIFSNNGQPYTQTTGQVISSPTAANDIAYGTILDTNGLPAEGAIVYLSLPNASPQSTLTKSSGSWAIPLSLARSKSLDQYLVYDKDISVMEIVVRGDGLTSNATTITSNDSPVPNIALGKTYDFRQQGIASNLAAAGTGTVAVIPTQLTPTRPASFLPAVTPTPGNFILPVLSSPTPAIITVTPTATPTMSAGAATPTPTIANQQPTITILPEFTASGSATPTKKATPTPTVISPRKGLPSTESGIPVSGNLTPTFIVSIMGIALMLGGFVLPYLIKKN